MGATKVMVIRHAEKPGQYDQATYWGVNAQATCSGQAGAEHLITLGWARAGALVTLFTPPWGPPNPLATPDHLFASNNGLDGSQRPLETLTELARKLAKPNHQAKTIHAQYSQKEYPRMVADVLNREGVVLIAWQHEDIAWWSKDKSGKPSTSPGISQEIIRQTQTPLDRWHIPQSWPDDRYDLVFVFERPLGEGPIVGFEVFPQRLLAGDLATGLD